MSIYVSALRLDGDQWPRPIRYDGSHVLPSERSARAGFVMVSHIPGFIERDQGTAPGNDGTEDYPPWPWLRLSVNTEDVVLDWEQASRVYHYLGDWLMASADPPSKEDS